MTKDEEGGQRKPLDEVFETFSVIRPRVIFSLGMREQKKRTKRPCEFYNDRRGATAQFQ